MNLGEPIWGDHHHKSSFLPNMAIVEKDINFIVPPDIVENPQSHSLTQDTLSKRNLANITLTISMDILKKPRVMENIHISKSCFLVEIKAYTSLFKELCDIFTWYYEEMIGIDPSIVIHMTYDG